jgi:hypothetical protein
LFSSSSARLNTRPTPFSFNEKTGWANQSWSAGASPAKANHKVRDLLLETKDLLSERREAGTASSLLQKVGIHLINS